jgi:hypothetical protein
VRRWGIDFPNPVGLAAGFDKSGASFNALAALGFGFVEIGTVTAEPQPGNPRPRLFRLPADRALLNRMGFNNPGAEAVARGCARRRIDPVLGINLGKSKVDAAGARDGRLPAELRAAGALRPLPGGQRQLAQHAGAAGAAGRAAAARAAGAHRPPRALRTRARRHAPRPAPSWSSSPRTSPTRRSTRRWRSPWRRARRDRGGEHHRLARGAAHAGGARGGARRRRDQRRAAARAGAGGGRADPPADRRRGADRRRRRDRDRGRRLGPDPRRREPGAALHRLRLRRPGHGAADQPGAARRLRRRAAGRWTRSSAAGSGRPMLRVARFLHGFARHPLASVSPEETEIAVGGRAVPATVLRPRRPGAIRGGSCCTASRCRAGGTRPWSASRARWPAPAARS